MPTATTTNTISTKATTTTTTTRTWSVSRGLTAKVLTTFCVAANPAWGDGAW